MKGVERPQVWRVVRRFLPFTSYPYIGEPTPCNLCGSRDATIIGKVDRRLKPLVTVCCSRCGLIRVDPMPTAEELARYYAEDYRFDYQFAGKRGPPKRHLVRSVREAKARVMLLAPALRNGARVLDFGSGSGEFLAAARTAGCDVVGIEPGGSYAAFARRRHRVKVIDSDINACFPAEHFDVITANHVLEHLREPVDTLMRLAGWLAPEGVLFVSVPNMGATDKLTHERFHFAHVHGFVPETLDLAMLRCGLEPDPRFPRDGTTAVYVKTGRDVPPCVVAPELGARIVQLYPRRSAFADIASCAWVLPALRRWLKAGKDSFLQSGQE